MSNWTGHNFFAGTCTPDELGNIKSENISFVEDECEYEHGFKCVDVRICDNKLFPTNKGPMPKPTVALSTYGTWVYVIGGDLVGGLDGCNVSGWMPDEQTVRISLTRQMEAGNGTIVSDASPNCSAGIAKFMAHVHDYVYANRIKLLGERARDDTPELTRGRFKDPITKCDAFAIEDEGQPSRTLEASYMIQAGAYCADRHVPVMIAAQSYPATASKPCKEFGMCARNELRRGAALMPVLRLAGLWFADGRYGTKWYVIRSMVYTNRCIGLAKEATKKREPRLGSLKNPMCPKELSRLCEACGKLNEGVQGVGFRKSESNELPSITEFFLSRAGGVLTPLTRSGVYPTRDPFEDNEQNFEEWYKANFPHKATDATAMAGCWTLAGWTAIRSFFDSNWLMTPSQTVPSTLKTYRSSNYNDVCEMKKTVKLFASMLETYAHPMKNKDIPTTVLVDCLVRAMEAGHRYGVSTMLFVVGKRLCELPKGTELPLVSYTIPISNYGTRVQDGAELQGQVAPWEEEDQYGGNWRNCPRLHNQCLLTAVMDLQPMMMLTALKTLPWSVGGLAHAIDAAHDTLASHQGLDGEYKVLLELAVSPDGPAMTYALEHIAATAHRWGDTTPDIEIRAASAIFAILMATGPLGRRGADRPITSAHATLIHSVLKCYSAQHHHSFLRLLPAMMIASGIIESANKSDFFRPVFRNALPKDARANMEKCLAVYFVHAPEGDLPSTIRPLKKNETFHEKFCAQYALERWDRMLFSAADCIEASPFPGSNSEIAKLQNAWLRRIMIETPIESTKSFDKVLQLVANRKDGESWDKVKAMVTAEFIELKEKDYGLEIPLLVYVVTILPILHTNPDMILEAFLNNIGHPSTSYVANPSNIWRALLAMHGYYRRRFEIDSTEAPYMGFFCEMGYGISATKRLLSALQSVQTPLPDYLDLRGARTPDSMSYMPQGLPFVMLPGSLMLQLKHLSLLGLDVLSFVRVVQPAAACALGVYFRSLRLDPVFAAAIFYVASTDSRYDTKTLKSLRLDLVEKVEYPFDTQVAFFSESPAIMWALDFQKGDRGSALKDPIVLDPKRFSVALTSGQVVCYMRQNYSTDQFFQVFSQGFYTYTAFLCSCIPGNAWKLVQRLWTQGVHEKVSLPQQSGVVEALAVMMVGFDRKDLQQFTCPDCTGFDNKFFGWGSNPPPEVDFATTSTCQQAAVTNLYQGDMYYPPSKQRCSNTQRCLLHRDFKKWCVATTRGSQMAWVWSDYEYAKTVDSLLKALPSDALKNTGILPEGYLDIERSHLLTDKLKEVYVSKLASLNKSDYGFFDRHSSDSWKVDVVAILARRMPESIQMLASRGMFEKHVARRALLHLSDMANIIRRNNLSSTKSLDATAPFEAAAIKLFESHNDLEVLVSEDTTDTIDMEEVRKCALKQICGKIYLGRAVLLHKWYETFTRASAAGAEGANADGEVQFVSQKRACDWNKDPAILAKAVNLCDDEPAPPGPKPSSAPGPSSSRIVIDVDTEPQSEPTLEEPAAALLASFGLASSTAGPSAADPPQHERVWIRVKGVSAGSDVKRVFERPLVQLAMGSPRAPASATPADATVTVRAHDGEEYAIAPRPDYPEGHATSRKRNEQEGYSYIEFILRTVTGVDRARKDVLVVLLRHFLHPKEVDARWGTTPGKALSVITLRRLVRYVLPGKVVDRLPPRERFRPPTRPQRDEAPAPGPAAADEAPAAKVADVLPMQSSGNANDAVASDSWNTPYGPYDPNECEDYEDPGSLEDLEADAEADVDDLLAPPRKRARTDGELAWASAHGRALVSAHGLHV